MISRLSRAGRGVTRRVRQRRGGGEGFFEEVRRSDTYLVSFPRSGNTYLRYLVTSLMLDRAPTPAEVHAIVPDVHAVVPPLRPAGRRVVAKSHAPARPVPAQVVYLVRDGRDALLSYYFYLQRRGQPTPASPDAMLEWPHAWPCPWPDHVEGWLRYLDGRGRALVVRYEDLVADPIQVLGRVAALAGFSVTEGGLERAVRNSSVESMRAAERDDAPGSLNFVGPAGPGPGRDAFGSEALRRFETRCGPLLARLGYAARPSGDA